MKERLDRVPESRARNLNLFFSSLAGVIYIVLGLYIDSLSFSYLLGGLILAGVSDWSTVYFVHSGVLSGTLDRVMSDKKAGLFMKIHLWPGIMAYLLLGGFAVSLLFFQQINLLYYGFLAGWLIMYFSGLYPYSKLR